MDEERQVIPLRRRRSAGCQFSELRGGNSPNSQDAGERRAMPPSVDFTHVIPMKSDS